MTDDFFPGPRPHERLPWKDHAIHVAETFRKHGLLPYYTASIIEILFCRIDQHWSQAECVFIQRDMEPRDWLTLSTDENLRHAVNEAKAKADMLQTLRMCP